ncbi:AlwI family type II restriction endonuclease [Streptococcus pasteurianus]|uniref:AlwI family type II restriction endonuclease n=1 Tax=Streptococcus pasteurianus TaxID=197614 RepID=UPI0030133EB7
MPDRRKPISFNTTLRNPERIPQFVSILAPFEGKILDDEVALEIEAKIIINKIFEPTSSTLGTYVSNYDGKFHYEADDKTSNAVLKVKEYFSEWQNSKEGAFSFEKMKYLLKNTITKHKEAGWKGGWESRLQTQYVFLNELGLTYVVKGEKIKISPNGKLMMKQYSEGFPINDNFNREDELSAFLIAFSKYQVNNPFRRNTVKVNFFPLVLNTINYLDEKYKRPGISTQDLAFIIAWSNNDYQNLAEYIYEFRRKFGYEVSNEFVYEHALDLLDDSTDLSVKQARSAFISFKKNDYKFDKITRETPDEVIRKLRLTMLISLRGAGRFIDINKIEADKVQHIITNYSKNLDFEDVDSYFDYMGQIDSALVFEAEAESEEFLEAKEKVIKEWSKKMDWASLEREMLHSEGKGNSDDTTLKYIPGPTRLEFLCAIAIKKALPKLKVVANYKADDNGIPFGHASGNRNGLVGSDIDVYENNIHATLEPTLSRARSFQVEHELPSIRTHIFESAKLDKENGIYDEWFSLLIAPKIAKDVGNQVAVVKHINHIDIYPWEISDFISFSKKVMTIKDYKVIRSYAEVETL